jgi:hypothetical protein
VTRSTPGPIPDRDRRPGLAQFEFYLHDRRTIVPEREQVDAAGLEAAKQLARRRLAAAPDLVGIEVRQGGQFLAVVSRDEKT